MDPIGTVLCPVDFSDATERQLTFAIDLCRLFGARLVLHHNLEEMPPGAAVGWMYAEAHHGPPSEEAAEERLNRLLGEVPEGIVREGRITHGLPTRSILILSEMVGADLVVLTAHDTHREDHGSVTEQLLERALAGVLVLHEASVDHAVPRFGDPGNEPQTVLVPTSFSVESKPAVGLAFDLARRLPLALRLLHIEPARVAAGDSGRELEEKILLRLASLVPEELSDRTELEIAYGDPSHEIAAVAERARATLIVMGEHTRAPLKRWFHRDTSRAVLHHAHCPVWYVPAAAAR